MGYDPLEWMDDIFCLCVYLRCICERSGLGWFVSSIFSFTQGGSYFGSGRALIYIANACMGFDRTGIQRFFPLITAHSVCWSIPDGLESE
jgi:hypothetical protein